MTDKHEEQDKKKIRTAQRERVVLSLALLLQVIILSFFPIAYG